MLLQPISYNNFLINPIIAIFETARNCAVQEIIDNKSKMIFASIWSNLLNASEERKHPWRYIQLSTVINEQAFARTVVLRTVNKDQRSIECHTDYRSPKIQHIKQNPKILFLAFNPVSKIQINCFAIAKVHHRTPFAESRWLSNHRNNQLTYANKYPPSSELSSYSQLKDNVVTLDEFDAKFAYNNFAVIETKVHQIDYLSLETGKHTRAQFRYENKQWASKWLAP